MFRSRMTLDSKQKGMTLFAVLLVGAILAIAMSLGRPAQLGTLLSLPITVGALAVGWAMAPRAVVVQGGELRIERRAWSPLRVPLSSVISASPVTSLGGGVLRLFGTGGFFGSYGLFRSNTLGRFRLYATRGGMAVLVKRKDGIPMVITHDDVDGAIAAIDPRVASLPSRTGGAT